MNDILNLFYNNKNIQLLVIFITVDVIFGVLRAIKEKTINSTIGIDGIIRKIGMIISIIVCIILDKIINIDLIGFIPSELKNYLSLDKVGIATLFNMLYVIFEILSIFKNMIKCNLPLPNKLKVVLEKLLKEFTSEIKE